MDHKTTFSFPAAAVVVMASLSMMMSTSALGACKTTLRGELVQAPVPGRAFPKKLLFFNLAKRVQSSAFSPSWFRIRAPRFLFRSHWTSIRPKTVRANSNCT